MKGVRYSCPFLIGGVNMELKLYHTLDNENVINKTLTLIHTMRIKLKDTVSITNPILILSEVEGVNYFHCNYCYLSEFNRYYFIRDIEVLSTKNYKLQLEVDVLESFKNDILSSHAEIKRTLQQGDFVYVNNIIDVRKEIDIYESATALIKQKDIVLSTIGG